MNLTENMKFPPTQSETADADKCEDMLVRFGASASSTARDQEFIDKLRGLPVRSRAVFWRALCYAMEKTQRAA